MRVVRGIEVQPVDPVHHGLNLLDVKHIGDDDVGAQGLQTGTALVVAMHQSPGANPAAKQLGGHRSADPARGAGYQHSGTCHRILFFWI
ncbi:hypothetical protein A4G26_05395 [Mycobacterium kansasii]|uniref:Uncharacterized protein n=1 Tax=Mycobacterium innocens TaxID=2341083 RepID=A0A498PSY8_9MYCO|nr:MULTISPECIES: hypothetical protein [Mycobacterium]KZS74618.1 hypothetical protein A4G26_05395 [Mycobacterium kansasii]VBA35904.1 hypothetical protein LAUMK13_00934 [Mycobacterium innocens]